MKILFITDLYPIGNENISRALYYFIREWQKQGHLVDVIRPNFIFNTKIRGRKIIQEKIYIENGIKIYNLNFHTPFWFNVRNKLPKDFSLKNYDVMISHMPCGALMAQKLLEKETIKYICAVHSSDITVLTDYKYSFYFAQKLKKSYLLADKISARSFILQKKIEKIIPEVQDKTFVAYSGIDNISEHIDNRKFDYDKLKICTACSLIKRKNIEVILKALSKIQGDFFYTVIGSGKESKNLKKLVKKLKIEKNVKFTGKLSRSEVFETMKKNDIFILLSNNETFGLVYLEAMSAGNIVIAKKDDGIDGILQNEQNGFLISANCDELKKCLEMIHSLKETEIEKIRKNSIDTVRNLTIEKAAQNYLDNIFINY